MSLQGRRVFSLVAKVQVWSFHCISQVAGHNGEIYGIWRGDRGLLWTHEVFTRRSLTYEAHDGHDQLLGGIPIPLKNMSSSIGMISLPNLSGKIKVMF